jgi:uncharacterized protein (TIGR01777 family)
MTKKILITGASGLVGRKLISHLTSQGAVCKVLTANKKQKYQEHQYYWNPEQGMIDEHCLDDVDVVIHLAGAGIAGKRWTESYKKKIMDSRVKGAELLLNLAMKKNKVMEHFISASGIGIYASGTDAVLDEQAALGNGFLADVCRRWEEKAFNFERIGAHVSVVRTAVVLAPDGGFLEPFNLAMRFRILPVFGSKKQHLSWIHLDDLVAIYARLALESGFSGVYNASAPEATEQKAFLQTLALSCHRHCFFPVMPAWVVRLLFGEQAALLLSDQKVRPAKLLSQGFVFTYPKLREALYNIYEK